MEPLKEMFNKTFYRDLSTAIKKVYSAFDDHGFLTAIEAEYLALSLNERLKLTTRTLHNFLPENYERCLNILKKVVLYIKPGYTTLICPDFVAKYGLEHADISLEALKYFTPFGSSEFAVREFLINDFDYTISVMTKWAEDKNHHVRRLASEGSRPRLPWSFKLNQVINNPTLTIPILNKLRTDSELYVRKSVANHLNDIGKDHPEILLDLVKSWDIYHPHTAWIVKHGCRSLIKKGDPRALQLFDAPPDVKVEISKLKINPKHPCIGESMNFTFDLVSLSELSQKIIVDYILHYRKKSEELSPKVFKLKVITLEPKQKVNISKNQRFTDFTTRIHFPGIHLLQIQVNGLIKAEIKFDLKN